MDIINDIITAIASLFIAPLLNVLWRVLQAGEGLLKALTGQLFVNIFSNNEILNHLYQLLVAVAGVLVICGVSFAIIRRWLQAKSGGQYLIGFSGRLVIFTLFVFGIPFGFFLGLTIIGSILQLVFSDLHLINLIDALYLLGFTNVSDYQYFVNNPNPFGDIITLIIQGRYEFWFPLIGTIIVVGLFGFLIVKVIVNLLQLASLYIITSIAAAGYLVSGDNGLLVKYANDYREKSLYVVGIIFSLSMYLTLASLLTNGLLAQIPIINVESVYIINLVNTFVLIAALWAVIESNKFIGKYLTLHLGNAGIGDEHGEKIKKMGRWGTAIGVSVISSNPAPIIGQSATEILHKVSK